MRNVRAIIDNADSEDVEDGREREDVGEGRNARVSELRW